MNVDPNRVQAVFAALLDVSDSAVRGEILDRECGDDVALRQRVEDLIRAHEATRGFGNLPSGAPFADRTEAIDSLRPGTTLAQRYKLLEAIGEGGMGTVWIAEQTEPVRRKVAIKLIKAGLDSRQVLARFEAERQALALM